MTIDSVDDSNISNRTVTTNRISNRTYDSKSNRITKLRRALVQCYHLQWRRNHRAHGHCGTDKKLTKMYCEPRQCSPKRLIVHIVKKVERHDKFFPRFAQDMCAPLSKMFRRHVLAT